MKYEVTSQMTKQAFASSLKKKLKTKSLSKISVTELVEDCHLNRKTFYYHFNDIDDLIKWIIEQELSQLLSTFDENNQIKDIIYIVINYVKQNYDFYECILTSKGYLDIKEFLHHEFQKVVIKTFNKYCNDPQMPEAYKNFLIDYYTVSLSGILIHYLTKEIRISQKELEQKVTYLDNYLKNSLPYILNHQTYKSHL